MRLVQQIERLFGQRLPLSTLHAHTTVETLARAMVRRQQDTFAVPVLKLQADGTRRPFFFFHGDLNGGGFYCRELARHLGPDQPFFAIHPLGLDGRPIPATIEAMAAEHLAQIRALQPHGPYFIGGYCNGGLTAYEVARALTDAGERVEPIVLIAADADTRFARLRAVLAGVAGRLGLREDEATAHFGRWRYLVTRFAASRTRGRIRLSLGTAAAILAGLLRRLGVAGRAPLTWVPVPGSAEGLVSPETYARYYTAVLAYVPRPFRRSRARVLAGRADRAASRRPHPRLGPAGRARGGHPRPRRPPNDRDAPYRADRPRHPGAALPRARYPTPGDPRGLSALAERR